MRRRRRREVVEVIADLISVINIGGNKLAVHCAGAISQSELVGSIGANTVGKRQRLRGFAHDHALKGATAQQAGEKKGGE